MKITSIPLYDPSSSPRKIVNSSSLTISETQKLKGRLFLKYFPKHIRTPCFDSKQDQLLLRTRVKYTKGLPQNCRSPVQFFEFIKLFTSLTSIDSGNLVQVFKNMRRLKNLRSFRSSKLTKRTCDLRNHLNSLPKLLHGLETLSISGCLKNEQDLFSLLPQSKVLLKQVTELHLGISCNPSHQSLLQSVVQSCPDLEKLSFYFSCSHEDEQCVKVNSDLFRSLQFLYRLTSLELPVSRTVDFFRDFILPPSVQTLTLDFKECLSEEILSKIEETWTRNKRYFFFENSKSIKFYEKFRGSQELESLKLYFNLDDGFENCHSFTQNLLKEIPSLKSLTFLKGGRSSEDPDNIYPMYDSLFPKLLESCHHFGHTLEDLEIGHERLVFYPYFDLSSSRNKFPKLSSVKVTGKIESSFQTFFKEILSLGGSIKTIKLNTFCEKSSKCLLVILKELNELQGSELDIELEIKFLGSNDDHEVVKDFENGIKELQENEKEYPFLQGVSLKLITSSMPFEPLIEFLTLYEKKFRHFENVTF